LKHARDEAHLRRLAHRLQTEYGDPLIIIGMHRSGTSMMTRLLRDCGGYFGHRLHQGGSEAYVFLLLNWYILAWYKSDWYALVPDLGLHEPVQRRAIAGYVVRLMRHHLWTGYFQHFGEPGVPVPDDMQTPPPRRPWRNSFLLNWPRKRGSAPFWGFKDPSTTLTLPVWLELFPGARVLHMVRNGIGSALSLSTRARRTGVGAPQCEDPIYSFRLWERYVQEGLRWRSLPPDRYLELRYEDVLADTKGALAAALRLVGVTARIPDDVDQRVDETKASTSRWSEHPELLAYAQTSPLQRMFYGDGEPLAKRG
jgi:hypothetical protein